MVDNESIEKLLRAVLQSSKEGVPVSSIQSDYHSLCGESIPLKRLGYSNIEDYLRSIPSVVRLGYDMGQLKCFAVVCQETSHIAELVAKQKSSKKSGRPKIMKHYNKPVRKVMTYANGQKLREKPPQEVWINNNYESGSYNVELVRRRMSKLLEKYCSGLWMSKLSVFYRDMFRENLHPHALIDMAKWTDICIIEKPSIARQSDRLIYPPLPPKPSLRPVTPPTTLSTAPSPVTSHPSAPKRTSVASTHSTAPAGSSHNPPSSHSSTAPPHLTKSVHLINGDSVGVQVRQNLPKTLRHQSFQRPALALLSPATQHGSNGQTCPETLTSSKEGFSTPSSSTPRPPSESSVVPSKVFVRVKEILCQCGQGVWASALPKLYMDTYKVPFPEQILDNLSLLLDICRVEYPLAHDKTKAILYSSLTVTEAPDDEDKQCKEQKLPSGVKVWGPVMPPCLVGPSVQYSSVLITDVNSSNAVTIRFVGENYSNAQEAMEETMCSFYNQSSVQKPLSKPVVGQLVAVREEDGEEVTRAQVIELISPDKVKVYYLDYGFFVETTRLNVLQLHRDFLSLPFQATCVRLAGLQAFCSHPLVLSSLNKLVGKILLMETIEPRQENQPPLVVLYDTSQDDDININSTCLKALQDRNMNNPLIVKATYQDVCVTNVDPEGIIYCQLPSRGRARLCKLLEETEAIFSSQVPSTFAVSRPFSGKVCLAQYKGKWSRVEITVTYDSKVVEILFIDSGLPMTVDVTELREFPPALLPGFTVIPPQITKCRLAELKVPEGRWSPEAVLLVQEAVLGAEDCKIMILELEQQKEDFVVYMYLFIGAEGLELDKSINRRLAQSEPWSQTRTPKNAFVSLSLSEDKALNPTVSVRNEPLCGADMSSCLKVTVAPETLTLPLPPPVELPQVGQYMDVFVTLADHPGHFVLQPWLDMHKLTILMGDMFLYYIRKWKDGCTVCVQKGEVYAAKVGKKWYRVQVKEIPDGESVRIYELDYGKTKVVHSSVFQPLIMEFRQLPFQAVVAQLAGVTQWSHEASMLFRKHVEHRPLVAKVESLSDVKGYLWNCRLSVYLVDTSLEDKDIWIHSLMADISAEPSRA
ncbi:tudor domain-containing protein 7A isoform X1 [Takifugu rubripes]|uniref:tudor domain-containing protein 7A isoform X1 n=1 Tax=Takifugu rubripes TaxID=31033 RepID=UPI001145A7C4|nr:tudor domain-containing protein 7B isoform X1 [Takifugu rubripes]